MAWVGGESTAEAVKKRSVSIADGGTQSGMRSSGSEPVPDAAATKSSDGKPGWGALFEDYEVGAQDATKLMPYVGGELVAFMSGKEAHKMACYLTKKSTKKDLVQMLAYTFDLSDLSEALVDAAKRGVNVEILVDYRSTLGGPTRDMAQRLRGLRANGVNVVLATGMDTQGEYAEAGRAVRPGRGLLHAKVYRMGEYLVCGSANWTTSSKCNVEFCTLTRLSARGVREFEDRIGLLRSKATPLTAELEIEAEASRTRVAERRKMRSASPDIVRTPERQPGRAYYHKLKRSPSSPPLMR
jgi:uncharacterized small protein (DUF1192 family)